MQMRTLEEMKISRGGYCWECGVGIMDPSQKDHSFCNKCWWDYWHHTLVISLDESGCIVCGYPINDEQHASVNPYE